MFLKSKVIEIATGFFWYQQKFCLTWSSIPDFTNPLHHPVLSLFYLIYALTVSLKTSKYLPDNTFLQLAEGLRRSFPPLELRKKFLYSPHLLIPLINTRNKKDEILNSPGFLISSRNKNMNNQNNRTIRTIENRSNWNMLFFALSLNKCSRDNSPDALKDISLSWSCARQFCSQILHPLFKVVSTPNWTKPSNIGVIIYKHSTHTKSNYPALPTPYSL